MKMPVVSAGGEEGGDDFEPSKILKLTPTLNAFLSEGMWASEAVAKGQRSMMIFVEAPFVKCFLKVTNPPLKGMVTARSFDDVLVAVDQLLKTDQFPWQCDPDAAGRGAKKKK